MIINNDEYNINVNIMLKKMKIDNDDYNDKINCNW